MPQIQLTEVHDIKRPHVGILINQRDYRDRRAWRIVPTGFAIQRAKEFVRSAERLAAQDFNPVIDPSPGFSSGFTFDS